MMPHAVISLPVGAAAISDVGGGTYPFELGCADCNLRFLAMEVSNRKSMNCTHWAQSMAPEELW